MDLYCMYVYINCSDFPPLFSPFMPKRTPMTVTMLIIILLHLNLLNVKHYDHARVLTLRPRPCSGAVGIRTGRLSSAARISTSFLIYWGLLDYLSFRCAGTWFGLIYADVWPVGFRSGNAGAPGSSHPLFVRFLSVSVRETVCKMSSCVFFLFQTVDWSWY